MSFDGGGMRKISLFMSIFVMAFAVDVNANEVCLSGICLGMPASALNVDFDEMSASSLSRIKNSVEGKAGFKQLLFRRYGLNGGQEEVLNASPYVSLNRFDRKGLLVLSKVDAFCSPVELTAQYRTSKNKMLTEITIAPKIIKDKPILVVSRIRRYWNERLSPIYNEKDKARFFAIKKSLQDKFGEVKNDAFYEMFGEKPPKHDYYVSQFHKNGVTFGLDRDSTVPMVILSEHDDNLKKKLNSHSACAYDGGEVDLE